MTPSRLLLSTAILAAATGAASAETLRMALKAEHPSVDPHFSRTSPGQNTASHIFEGLAGIDETLQPVPLLAESWENVDPTTWRIRLRDGVTFHDGTTLDAQDVITTFERIPNVANSPASFESNVASIASIEAEDDLTLLITTDEPTPDLIEQIGSVYILPSELGTEISSRDFDSGTAAIGTGPWRYGGWTPNERLNLTAFEDYWGDAPAFSDVVIRYIPNDAGRVAALIAGDVDVIDAVPAGDVPAIESRSGAQMVAETTGRLIYLALDSDREDSPFVSAPDGGNPLQDVRVRQALSLMLDRQMISDRIMNGTATPTGQLVPEGFVGWTDQVPVPQADPEAARALLAEAGYPDGFSITLHGPNNRYQNDAQILQAVSQLFARAGLTSTVEAMPSNIFFDRASQQEFSAFLGGFGTTTGSAIRGLQQVIATSDPEAGTGGFNRTRFSDPGFDALVARAAQSFDEAERDDLLAQATVRAFTEQQAIIPLHFEQQIWALREGLTYDARPIERTLAQDIRPAE